MPAVSMKNSDTMCVMLPWPAEAKLIVPGFCLARAISSGIVFAGNLGLAMTIIGPWEICTTGVISAIGSYFSG